MFKTGLLLAGITALFLAVGFLLGGEGGMMVALVFALAMNFFSYWFSDSIVLKMYRAEALSPERNGDLYAMIERLSQKAGIPTPKAYLIDSAQPNAFATGRSPGHAAVAVTSGLLSMLNEREIAAVIAHELGHIKNRDTLIMTVTATFAGAIGMLAQMAMFFGGNRNDGRGAGPVAGLLIAVLAPVMAMLVQLAISRTREFGADKSGAEFSEDPLSLASALRKISRGAAKIPNYQAEAHPGTAHLFIMNPLTGGGIGQLFATHPAPEKRIAALEALAAAAGHAPRAADPRQEKPSRPVKRGSFDFS